MSMVSWMLFGLIVGILANAIDPNPDRGGILGSILLGIVGALVGGFLANLIFGINISGFNLNSFFISVFGSLLLLYVGRSMHRI